MGKLEYLVAAKDIDKIIVNNSVTNSVTNGKKEVILNDKILKQQEFIVLAIKSIIKQKKTILLIGTGNNGKSYILHKIRDYIIANKYKIIDANYTAEYFLSIDISYFMKKFNMNTLIFTLKSNPYTNNKPKKMSILDINHIKF